MNNKTMTWSLIASLALSGCGHVVKMQKDLKAHVEASMAGPRAVPDGLGGFYLQGVKK